MPGKMTLKERLVDRHVLESDDSLVLLYLENPVDEKERIAVWQDLHDVFDRIHPLLLSAGFHQLPYQRNRSTMTRLHRDYARPHARAGERQITNTIHCLV